MSGQQKNTGKSMLARLTDIEKRKAHKGEVSGLSPERALLLKQRLLTEKETILASFDKSSAIQVARKSSRLKIWIPAGIAAMLLIGIGFYLLPAKSQELETRITFSKGNANILTSGSILPKATSVSTNPDSMLLLQQGENVETLIGQNTRFKVQRTAVKNGKPNIELLHESGLIYCAVDKGKADLNIATPGAQIRVVGTRFSIQTDDQATQVAVLEGTVQVIPNKKEGNLESEKPRPLSSGQILQISLKNGSITERSQTQGEQGLLNMLHELVLLPKDSSGNQRNTLAERILTAQNKSKMAIPAAKLTLADIRKKYGKISRVNLTNGRSYTGFFTMRGKQLQIITPNGTVRVASDLLKDVRDAE